MHYPLGLWDEGLASGGSSHVAGILASSRGSCFRLRCRFLFQTDKQVSLFLQQEYERLESAGWEVTGPEWSHKVVEVLPGLAAGHNDCPLWPVARLIYPISV